MKWLVLLVAISGCAVGAGGSAVGVYRAKRVVDTTACIESSPGVCAKTIDIGTDQPARSFGGGIFTFSAPGYARISGNGMAENAFVLDGSYEYLRGRGGFAVGGRVGLTLLDGAQHSWLTLPVTAMGYYGGRWGSLYAGAGYAPLVAVSAANMPTVNEHDGVEGLFGTRIYLSNSLGRFMSVSPEVRYQRAGGASILSSVVSLCVHF